MHLGKFSDIDRIARRWIANIFPGRFPKLYSTLDDPLEVPVQVAAYQLVTQKYIECGDRVLDVGFGVGYGLKIMAEEAEELTGIDVDPRIMPNAQKLTKELSKIRELRCYDGHRIPYSDGALNIVTCIDVIEHVSDYMGLIMEMVRVSERIVVLSTPNRRPEYTKRNGKPKNPWHLREWSFRELDSILDKITGVQVEWTFLNGPWHGPFECSSTYSGNTMALVPALIKCRS